MNFSETDNTLHCLFSGKLDGNVCSMIERELFNRVADFKNGHQSIQLVFDLSGANYISSSFLRICLIHYKLIGKNSFLVVNVSEEIHKVFHISGFSEIMNVIQC